MFCKKCCFIGHRKIKYSIELESKLYSLIEDLIINKRVKIFLFGSASEFNLLCSEVVDKLKLKYKDIKKVAYLLKSEAVIYKNDKSESEERIFRFTGKKVKLVGVDENCEYKNKYTSCRAAYVERNEALISDSDYCVFYYNKTYSPPVKSSFTQSQPKSGTAIAYKYAVKKKKTIINLFK